MKSEMIEAGPPLARCPASKRDRLGSSINSANNPTANSAQVCLRADLIGASTATAAGITANGATPVLGLCRRLLAAGHDPATRLDVYRGAMVALRVRSIGEAARLVVKTSGNGVPIFAVQEGAGGPLMRAIEGDREF